LADENGRVQATVVGRGANLQSEGEAGIEAALRELLARILGDTDAPAVICLGMAGADRPEDFALVRGVLARIGRGARSVVVNDALLALEAGSGDGPGVVVISGTGSIAYGRDRRGRAARAGGWGYVLGDEGSGYWLGRQALRSVVRAADGRGQPTALTPRVLAHYGAARPQDLIHEIAGGGARPSAIAQLAQAVGEAAADADPVAQHLIRVAAQELTNAAESVVRRLALGDAPLWLAGGTLLGVEPLRRALLDEVARRLPSMEAAALTTEPVCGAVRLACNELAGRLALPAYID
jgi:N-acetylglucosamine kinase-like BadF-type ATPase